MKKVYTVFGTTGEYSDRTEWPVCSFFDEELAKERVTKATLVAKEIEMRRGSNFYLETEINKFDKDMCLDYTGTYYFIITTDVLDSSEY